MDGVNSFQLDGVDPVRVLMLGWEFPPVISGGLGTACYWLTKSLSEQGVHVTFVLPTDPGVASSGSVRLLSAQGGQAQGLGRGVSFRGVPSTITSPYPSAKGIGQDFSHLAPEDRPIGVLSGGPGGSGAAPSQGQKDLYGGDLMGEVSRFAHRCVQLAANERFDVIHAHDWVTFPAGLAISAASGCPLVAHVHSTEFDRAGRDANQQVFEIESRGMHGAIRVIAVSHLTKSILSHRYRLAGEKVDVVYNGIDLKGTPVGVRGESGEDARIRKDDKIVLFLGRITMQKGPEYFIEAAKRVLERYERVKFVVAGSGDRIGEVIELAASHGIGHKVLFTGFLHSGDVERVYRMADLYVMPSVSEPFGITPLEAIRHDVPVIISKTSGVSEVLSHALKVDFWDTEDIANKILAILRHPPLGSELREQAELEVRGLTWDGAAQKCQRVYEKALAAVPV